ncbi:polyketide synthase [Aspergillus heteromorphus CBS 117.55]|uniref:Polyketide synthase n=1 Tax=Aspergillus heteromorphus CBS 117.55 TaxID=1448321 RepID=A0A317WPL0_9EURO|nr:polyketide synthase [Aspergillus heteromorphus CBS 117.55]PWY88369.1 polyketide synthase [Aspergillus heteromorphus CBS 117.55]
MDPSLQKLLATGGNTVLVFGPQVAVFDSKFIEHVRAGLAEGPDFLRHTISSLPEYWDGLVAELPEIEQTIPGKEHVQTLIHCLEHGLDQEIRRAPNMIVSPIAVIEEFLQYWRFLQMIHGNEGEATSDGKTDLQAWWLARQQNSKTATLGFCGGLFASFAVASSHTWEELEQNVAAMVRLSMVTSAMVDAYEVWDGRSESFAAICRQEQQGEQMRGILEELASDAHVQATFDVGCATLCVSQEQAPVLLDRLRAVGVKTSRLGIHGRAHHPGDQGRRSVAVLTKLCESMPGLRLPDASQVSMPTYNGATPISEGGLHEMAVRGILSQPCHWYRTFMAVHAQLDTPLVVSFGEECVPRSMVSGIRSTFLSMKALQRAKSTSNAEIPSFETVAIVGMAIKTAGADDIDEFASLLRSGQSQHERVRAERIPLDTSREWYANMMQDTDAFDHKFFKRSPRESATIDPQQRLFLQTVYQALEDAGYFATKTRTGSSPSNVGVFAGSTMNDYEHHTVGHSPGAFTGTATKSYIPARVAHFFGWTGPTIVYDTTCSSSMVALHAACRSLLSGECAAAVAGGVNIMTHPHTFRALAAGNFISPTGQCKPFDQAADGYCRAEAVGCVYLKRMSDAVRDGDRVIGAISSTAVLQNLNTTPFFVPNSPSLSQLLSTILDQAKMDPAAISVMEAHGTGTTVGDAAEYESIRQVVAGPKRARPLILGSVKGHVGHAEGTSGVVSLIKILAMMQENFIPPQASFSTLSSHLNATPTDMIEVSTALRKWPSGSRAAVISNYGATGSIAAMVVTKPPPRSEVSSLEHSHAGNLVPLWIAGLDERSISAYCVRLLRYLQSHPTAALSDIAFNVNQSSNRALPQRALLCCRSRKELEERLAQLASRTHTKTGEANPQITIAPKERPLILCFGGQAGQSIGLDRTLYENVTLLRDHLDQCDVAIQAAGAGSIYPGIFSREPIADQVHLQVMLFAMQYACARSWLDTGVLSRTVAVVGHSFGEITALCISGTLTLQETVQLLIARAKLVRDEWGNDSGAMLTINAEESTVTQILAEANVRYTGAHPASIACYNGPLQFTLGGSSEAIDAVQAVCDEQQPTIKTRRLAVTNAFHTSLVDPLCNRLAELNQRVSWKKPVIRQERATESPVDTPFHFAEHMRHPVYFRQAIQRLAEEHPSAVWLEAGSASGVTTMASGTLKTAAGPHSFHSLNVTDGRGGLDGLVTTTMSLWTEGIPVTFWGHHPVQASTVALRSLPPYQFEKSRHWLELKLPQDLASASSGSPERKEAQGLADLIKFVGNREETDSKNSIGGSYSRPYFAIDTSARLYSELLNGHVLNRTTPVLPVGVQIGLAFHALLSLRPQWVTDRMQPMVQDMINHAFICDDPSRKLWLEFHVKDEKQLTWDWAIVSTDGAELPHTRLMHVEARMQMYHPYDVAYQAEFRLLQTLASYKECSALFAHANTSSDADEGADEIQIAQGSTVYHLMDKVVQYGEPYRWLKRVVSRGSSAAGCVRKRKVDLASAFDVGLVDAFCQVGSIAINCMNDTVHPDDVWVHRGCNRWIRSPNVSTVRETSHVLVRHRHISDRLREMDVFVFDPTTGALVEAMLGARAVQFPKAALSDILTRLNADQPVSQSTAQVAHRRAAPVKDQGPQVVVQSDQDSAAEGRRGFEHTLEDVRVMVAKLLGVNENEVAPQSQLADLGIDSLMSVELGSDIETTFKCLPDEADMMEATSVEELALCIWNTLRGDDTAGSEKSEETLIVEKVGDGENPGEIMQRQERAQELVSKYTSGFTAPIPAPVNDSPGGECKKSVVIVTGGTGNLGSHVAALLSQSPAVETVVCLNRRARGVPAMTRQHDAFSSRGIELSQDALDKLRVLESTTTDAQLGLLDEDYQWLVTNGTDIIHCAFPLSPTQTVRGLEPQFQAMRHLLDLAHSMACQPRTERSSRVGFQMISSVSVVGYSEETPVREELRGMEGTQAMGYSEAKWVCEHILEATLRQYPEHFRAMTVRIGQIGGSTTSGFWTCAEHVPFLIKSAQTLRAWPDLGGHVSWVAVDQIATILMDLLAVGVKHDVPTPNSVYHIEHPMARTWKEMAPVMAAALNIPASRIIPVKEWVALVRNSPLERSDNPAILFASFFESAYESLMCGRVLDTTWTQAHSPAMAKLEPIGDEMVGLYIDAWKKLGFLGSQ